MGNAVGFQYGGIVPMISGPGDEFGLNSWDSYDHLRALHAERDGESWTTLILSYRDDTGEFGHELIYGDDRPELNVTNFRLLSREIIRGLRPTRGTPLDVPVTARGAWAVYASANEIEKPFFKINEYCTDRLKGGWRVYATDTRARPSRSPASATPATTPSFSSTTPPKSPSPPRTSTPTRPSSTRSPPWMSPGTKVPRPVECWEFRGRFGRADGIAPRVELSRFGAAPTAVSQWISLAERKERVAMYFSEARRHGWIPAPSAESLATLARWSILGLPLAILLARLISRNVGFITVYFAIPAGLVLAFLGLIPAGAVSAISDRVRPTPSLWWSYAGPAVWQLACFVGLGLNISDSFDGETYAPLESLIPYELEMVVAGWLVAIGFAGLGFSATSVAWIMQRQETKRKKFN
ncbi:hypothetical protein [Dietzia sp.]|uniref:hypothetical protein n=1 Tax=Dietzia sp. TaxID=1871616 RepID=UPI002FDADC58